ncbi:MAG: TIGR02186 family protein [Acidobacteriota bacterium]
MTRVIRSSAVLILLLAAVCPASAGTAQADAAAPTIALEPPAIEMGMFSSGTRLTASGRVADGAQVVVVVAGADARESFNRKARFGPIWIASGQVHVAGVPSVLHVFSAMPVDAFLRRDVIDRELLDATAVIGRMAVAPAEADEPRIRENYVELKIVEGRFRFDADAVHVERLPQGGARYGLDFVWPSTVPPGRYDATVYECRGGEVVGRATAGVAVREVGVAATVRDFADSRATVYGTLAVALMMTLGFGIDALVARFRRTRGRRPGRPGDPRAGKALPVH